MMIFIYLVILFMILFLLFAAGTALSVVYKHWRTKHIAPAPGQVWGEFGVEIIITGITPEGYINIEGEDYDSSQRQNWVETAEEWKENVENRYRYLVCDVEVFDDGQRH